MAARLQSHAVQQALWSSRSPSSSILRLASQRSNGIRSVSGGSAPHHTVSDQEIVHLASVPLHPLSLTDLVKYGRPPLSSTSLLSSARFTLSLLPPRLAHRLHAIRSLPYIVVSNPHISQIYRNYLHSLGTLLPFYRAGIHTLDDEAAFTDALADLVQTHSNTIPILARGLKECSRYLGDGEGRIGSRFLDEHLRARIGTRLVAEQHLALHLASSPAPGFEGRQQGNEEGGEETRGIGGGQADNFVGIIDTALSPVSVLRQCESFVGELCELRYGVRPSIMLSGASDARIAHVPTHLEYVLTELLKNAFRATIEHGREREPIEATIAIGCDSEVAADSKGSQTPQARSQSGVAGRNTGGSGKDGGQGGVAFDLPTNATSTLTIRIRDHGGGIPPEVLPKIWNYSFSTFDEDRHGGGGLATLSQAGADGGGTIAGLGYGLPLGRAYAEHFGGELNVEGLWGWGTDVFLRLKGLEMTVN